MAKIMQAYETPEERYKRMTLERLNDAQRSDAEGSKKKYCINIKHFLRLMKTYMIPQIIDHIEELYKELEDEIGAIKKKKMNKADQEAQITVKEYEFYDKAIVYGIDALQNSRIVQKEVEGIILAGKTTKDMAKLGAKIRKSKAVETVIENIEGVTDVD